MFLCLSFQHGLTPKSKGKVAMTTQINNYKDLMTKHYPPRKWLIQNLLPENSFAIMAGQPRSYKTFIMLEMALSVAKGERLFNAFDTEQTGVLILDEESGDQMLQERFKALNAPIDSLPIHFISLANKKMDENYAKEIIDICKNNGIKFVIVDCLTRFFQGNENDSGDMSKVLGHFKRISEQGISCLVIHHERKRGYQLGSSADAMRGSSDLLASCDIQLSVEREGLSSTINIVQNKNRYRKEMKPITIAVSEIDDDHISFEYSGHVKTKKDKHELNKQTVLQFIEDNAGCNKSEVERALQEYDDKLSQAKIRRCITELLAENLIREDTTNNSKNAHLLYPNNN